VVSSEGASQGWVLVVEDNPDLRLLYRMALKNEGHVVRLAEHGQAALDLLRASSDKPNLIILDLMMPVMDGWQFLAVKNADPLLAPIPVVVCSASKEHLPTDLPVLNKPVDLQAVLELVNQYCSKTVG
jgi:CheY-like chemotaxis protein